MQTATSVRVGPFEIQERLGSGGMAEVWLARHELVGASVAVKVMTGSRARDPKFRDEFRLEVQAAARLNHPGIVRVLDYGLIDGSRSPEFVNGSPYLVMEVADRGALDTREPRSFRPLKAIVLQVLDALAYSHARGVIHRDIKPANVLLATARGGRLRTKLTDFGIAHATSPNDVAPAKPEEAVGTALYMPPEQFKGEWRDYGPWTDLYALGCTVWRLVTGKPPFMGANTLQLALLHVGAPLPDFEPRFEVPAALEGWLRRLLVKDPRKRFACAADAALAFGAFSDFDSRMGVEDSSDMLDSLVTEFTPTTAWRTQEYPDTLVLPTSHQSGLSSGALASRETTVLVDAPRLDETHGRAEVPRLAIPADWRRVEVSYEDGVAGMGLGLFGLREIPFVDRDGLRDLIWGALRGVDQDGHPRVVLLRGGSGTGKTRVAQWVSQRADELGSAMVLRGTATPGVGESPALANLLERYFVTWGLSDLHAVEAHVERRLRDLWPLDVEPGFIQFEARAMAAILRPGQAPRAPAAERLAILERFVAQLGRTRPVIVWLDDAQWDDEALALVETLAVSESAAVLVLATLQEEALRERPETLASLDRLASLENVELLPLKPLLPEDHAELVQRLLGLEPEVSRMVSDATAGNPLFAIQLVGDWVDRGVLRPTPTGFELHPDASPPDDLHSLWTRRLRRVTEAMGGDDQQIALEIAAVLGDQVSQDEWRAACANAHVRLDEQLVPTLVDLGMIVGLAGGWAFVHTLLATSLRRMARDHGRWKALNRFAGAALQTTLDFHAPRAAERCARHFLEGEDYNGALEPLAAAIRLALAAKELNEAQRLVSERRHALATTQIAENDVRRVEQLLFEVSMMREGLAEGDADGLLDQVLRLGALHGWPVQAAAAYREKGELAAGRGHLEEALGLYQECERILAPLAEPAETAALLESRTWALKSLGRTDAARRDLERALDLHRAGGDKIRELNVINRLAFTFLADGDYAASRETAELGVELGREVGHRGAEAGCWTTLGEIERFEGNYDRARECYRRAEELDALCNNKHVYLVQSNAALLEIGAGNFAEALRRLDEIQPVMESIGFGWMRPFLELGRACCHAGLGEWHRFDAVFDAASQEIVAAGVVELDVGWLATIASELAETDGELARAQAAEALALDQWERMRDDRRARESRARMTRLRAQASR